jgi:hypothetical protein
VPINPLLWFQYPWPGSSHHSTIDCLPIWWCRAIGSIHCITTQIDSMGIYELAKLLKRRIKSHFWDQGPWLPDVDNQMESTVFNARRMMSHPCFCDGWDLSGYTIPQCSYWLSAKIYQNRFFHRCYMLEGNKLPIYFSVLIVGTIRLNTELFERGLYCSGWF